jgi:hypothetical protein
MRALDTRMFEEKRYCSRCKTYHPDTDVVVYCCGKRTRTVPRHSRYRERYLLESLKMSMGVLKQKTYIYTMGGTTITLEKATLIKKEANILYFNEYPELYIFKSGSDYIASYYDTPSKIIFPKGTERLPYPISLLS